jgi:hypothetical protein
MIGVIMKKAIYLFIILCLCFNFTGCSSKSESIINKPFEAVNTVYDIHGNILQQTVYNTMTDEYITTVFIYDRIDSLWVCTDQKTIRTSTKNPTMQSTTLNTVEVYYERDLMLEQTVLLKTNDITISVVECLNKASWWEFGYKIKVENTSAKVLSVSFDSATIMDIHCAPMFTIDHIDAGHIAYFTLAWDRDSLERACIPYIDNIKFMVRVFNTQYFDKPAVYGTTILIKTE